MTQHANIAAAFVAAQAQFTHVVASKEGQARAAKFTYADLSDLVEMARPVLAAHGLAFQSHNGYAPSGITCTTVFVHTSGESMTCGETFIAVPADAGAQAFGSAYTYARRYSLLAALGVAADDDDGVRAMQAQAYKVERAQKIAAAPKLTDGQEATLVRIMRVIGHAPNIAGKIAEDYPEYVDAAIAYVVKQGGIEPAFVDAVRTAALATDAEALDGLLNAEAVPA